MLQALFFVSGAASLILQVVWFHESALVFGNGVWAVTVVLSSFMGGLAIGTMLAARFGDRVANPLRVYACLEAMVAASGITLTYLLLRLGGSITVFTSFLLLLIPATAMGATLPLLVAASCSTGNHFSSALARLYGWNTFGAVVGVLGTELVAVDRVGVKGSAWIAVSLEIAVAIAAVAISGESSESFLSVRSEPSEGTRSVGRLLVAACLAGMALLSLEVLWFRFLTMFVLSTTLAASVMVAVVLAAIAAGGMAGALVRASSQVLAFACGVAVIVSYRLFQPLTSGIQLGHWNQVFWITAVLAAPTSCVSGLLFVRLGDALNTTRVAGFAGTAARLTMANTLGAAAGPFLAAFVLLPGLGTERSLFAIAAIYGVVGLLLTVRSTLSGWERAGGVALVVALIIFPFGEMTRVYLPRIAQPYTADGSTIVAAYEGEEETILLTQRTWLDHPLYTRLVTNGFSMSGTSTPAQRYMRYFAYWPALLRTPQSPLARALVICYGVGVTTDAVADIPGIHSIDVVEISRDIAATSDRIYPTDQHPLHDPRIQLHIEDGRHYLERSASRFDLITGEPPPPRTPGAVDIYTREYFRLVRDHLADEGVTTYWLPVARPNPGTDVGTIIRAFCDVFSDCSLWNATPSDFMLVGSRGRSGPVSPGTVQAAWQIPRLAARLEEVGFERPEQIGATFLGDAAYLRQLVGATPPLTDDFPNRLLPVAWRPSLSDPRYGVDAAVADLYQRVIDPARAHELFRSSPFIARLWPPALKAATGPFFEVQRVINSVLSNGANPLRHIDTLHSVLTTTPLETLPLWMLGTDNVTVRIAEASRDRSSGTEYVRGLHALATRDYRRAAAHFSESERLGEGDRSGHDEIAASPPTRPLLVYSLYLAGDLDTGRQLMPTGAGGSTDERYAWDWLRSRIDEQ